MTGAVTNLASTTLSIVTIVSDLHAAKAKCHHTNYLCPSTKSIFTKVKNLLAAAVSITAAENILLVAVLINTKVNSHLVVTVQLQSLQ